MDATASAPRGRSLLLWVALVAAVWWAAPARAAVPDWMCNATSPNSQGNTSTGTVSTTGSSTTPLTTPGGGVTTPTSEAPEPATLLGALTGLAFGVLAWRRRRAALTPHLDPEGPLALAEEPALAR